MEAAWPEGLGDWTRPFNLFIPRSDQKECSPYFINALSKGKIIRNGRGVCEENWDIDSEIP